MKINGLPVNFTVSNYAKAQIGYLRSVWTNNTRELPGLLSVSWGEVTMKDGHEFGQVIVSFYSEEHTAEMSQYVEHVSGLDLIFFITEKHWWRFSGKVLDHSAEKSFFLR